MALDFNALIQQLIASQQAQQSAVGQLGARIAEARRPFDALLGQPQAGTAIDHSMVRDRGFVPPGVVAAPRGPTFMAMPRLAMPGRIGSVAPKKVPGLFAPTGAVVAGPPKMKLGKDGKPLLDANGNPIRESNPNWAGF